MINYDSRGGISIETRKGEITTSHLLIQNADETNSGKYSCSPSNAIVASIRVHVLNGKWWMPSSLETLYVSRVNVCKLQNTLYKVIIKHASSSKLPSWVKWEGANALTSAYDRFFPVCICSRRVLASSIRYLILN